MKTEACLWGPRHPGYDHLLNNNGLMIDRRAGKGAHVAPPDTALFDKKMLSFFFSFGLGIECMQLRLSRMNR
jgi:hypothetical protein